MRLTKIHFKFRAVLSRNIRYQRQSRGLCCTLLTPVLKFVQKETQTRQHDDVLFEHPQILKHNASFDKDNKQFMSAQQHGPATVMHRESRESELGRYLVGIHQSMLTAGGEDLGVV